MRRTLLFIPSFAFVVTLSFADGPKDNIPENVRPIPPVGVAVPAADEKELRAGLDDLQQKLLVLKVSLKPDMKELIPDVEIFERAVFTALELKEFHNPKEIIAAKALLKIGLDRAKELLEGKPSWLKATGPVVRGYRSKLDDTVQPYGILVPEAFAKDAKKPRRLDFWWHGRGETLSENNFISGQLKSTPQFVPEDAFVLQPYGRYSNANKFAGEVDTFECLEHAKKFYPIDEKRIVARGFSMGGAACWQFATHFPTLWCAANPGAGFAETPEFLNVFQNEKVEPTWYEKKLWHMYNATDYAQNLFNLPTVAYSGENDRQKQAADVMARDMKKVGLELTHIIGPKTGHSYEKGAKVEVAKRIDEIVKRGKPDIAEKIKFVTYTLHYPKSGWVEVTGLGKHWERASVEGEVLGLNSRPGGRGITLTTSNVTDLTLRFPWNPLGRQDSTITIDGQVIATAGTGRAPTWPLEQVSKDWLAHFHKAGDKWVRVSSPIAEKVAKVPGLQGPIDDAFMSRFLMVSPSGQSSQLAVEKFVQGEMKHAIDHWRKHFRGEARVKSDKDVSDADIAESNLILWGDPQSNAVLAKIADKLPIKWAKDSITIGDKTYPAGTHVPVLIYPNPLNPKKYVVLNSGFTFREYAYLNNARQVPMLPDYAIVDITTPPNFRYPGKIVRAGFFGEKWELMPNDGQ